MNSIESLLKTALKRKPKRLTFESSYSHENLLVWLKFILPKWEIVIPIWNKEESFSALSDWPSNNIRDSVKKWLEEQNVANADDFLDGACEPLARYLTYNMIVEIENAQFSSISDTTQTLKSKMELLDPKDAAELVLGEYVRQRQPSPLYWGPRVVKSYKEYLFGHDLAQVSILEAVNDPSIGYLPLYILNYIFDEDELSDRELKCTVQETAQYSLHVVGIIFDKPRSRILIADPNGALIPGYNMEFLSMPLKRMSGKGSTKVSRFDLDSQKRKRGKEEVVPIPSEKKVKGV
jgi:hypothetical protein